MRIGGFSESDLFHLLVILRDFAGKRPLLRDLCHCLAHPDERNWGEAQGHVKRYIEQMTQVAQRGGTFGGPGLCNRNRLHRDLVGFIKVGSEATIKARLIDP